jgi:hypothetical protein
MKNTPEHESNVWNGTGQFFPKLQVRHLFDNEYRVIATRNPPSKHLDYNSIIMADSFEEAIHYIQNHDYFMYDEATLEGSGCEGG